MSESLSLFSGGHDGGGGRREGGGVIGLFFSTGIWLMKLLFPSVVDSLLTGSWLMSTSAIDVPQQLFFHSYECSMSSKVLFGERGCSFMCR